MAASASVVTIAPESVPEGERAAPAGHSVYLDAYLAPFSRWLARDTVTEIMVKIGRAHV